MEYLLSFIVFFSIYWILSESLDLLVGEAGLISLCHAAFYGVGAYSSAILSVRLDFHWLLGLIGGVLAATAAALVVALPSLRLRQDYFTMTTFGFQLLFVSIAMKWIPVTGGPLGIAGIPSFLARTDGQWRLAMGLLVCLPLGLVVYVIKRRLVGSPFGRVLRVMREDELLAQSQGKNTHFFKLSAFAVSGCMAAVAGSLFAHFVMYIDPLSFTLMESILVLAMVVLGGAATRFGPAAGAFLLVALPEALRFLGIPGPVAAVVREMVYGTILIILMLWRPGGLLGGYKIGRL